MTTNAATPERSAPRRPRLWARLRMLASWLLAGGLLAVALPRVVNVSWHGIIPALTSVHWPAAVILSGLWLLGLYVHSFVQTAAAPTLTHRRALTLNMAGSAVANVVPLGGAAGTELNRRMMKSWGIGAHAFAGYAFLTNLWDVASKLLLPVVAVVAFALAGHTVTPQVQLASWLAGIGFLGFVAFAAVLLLSPKGAELLGRGVERALRSGLRLIGRDRRLGLTTALHEVRRQCVGLVARGWGQMSAGVAGYVALQWLLLWFCLYLTGAGTPWLAVLVGFAIERLLTVIPITPGGVGLADLGLVATLLALGGNPVGVTAAAVLYRVFIFAVEVPVGGGVLGVWLLRHARRPAWRRAEIVAGSARRVAHVTDIFLPRLGGVETHVDDLVRHQRAAGIDAEVLTRPGRADADASWVRRLTARQARRAIMDYDTVHVHVGVWSPYGIAVARSAMAAGIPALVTIHSMWGASLLRLLARVSLRRWPVAWSAVSGAAAEPFRRALGDGRVAVLPNAIDVAAWRPGPAAPAPDPATVTLVSVMRLAWRKRPFQLLRMYEQVRRLTPGQDVDLVIVGDGALRRSLERRIRRAGLTGHVRVTGRVPRREVLDHLATASVYVAPAPKESFGIAALEARCAGLPIVASRHSGVGEFVRDHVDGLLVADDAEMVAAVAGLVRDRALRERMTAHNHQVAPHQDWSDVLRLTDALYLRAADGVRAAEPAGARLPAPVAAGV